MRQIRVDCALGIDINGSRALCCRCSHAEKTVGEQFDWIQQIGHVVDADGGDLEHSQNLRQVRSSDLCHGLIHETLSTVYHGDGGVAEIYNHLLINACLLYTSPSPRDS